MIELNILSNSFRLAPKVGACEADGADVTNFSAAGTAARSPKAQTSLRLATPQGTAFLKFATYLSLRLCVNSL
jgi:hypothetical protein